MSNLDVVTIDNVGDVNFIPELGKLELVGVLLNNNVPENIKKEVNNFFLAIGNVKKGEILENEINNLLKVDKSMEDFNDNLRHYGYFDFDGDKIVEKINSFLIPPKELEDSPEDLEDYSESLKHLCLRFLEEILNIRDEKKIKSGLGNFDSNYFDLVGYYNELRGISDTISDEVRDEINNFYVNIHNIKSGIIRDSEKENLLKYASSNKDFCFDADKIISKVEYFMEECGGYKNLFIGFLAIILEIRDKKNNSILGGYDGGYADLVDYYKKLKEIN